ncbi:large conductance mechanosensitive channel protein MscL [Flavimobilis marinus]|nr:large conductance mechanosensitive channel protein MscL [Flavimobilis marinus]
MITMKDILQGFKNFIMRGNVIELAVAFVIGAAFAEVVKAIVEGLLTPLIAALFGEVSLGGVLQFTINNADFYPGVVLNALITFLFTAAAIYFFVVLPINKLAERRNRGKVEEPAATAEDVLLLQEIRDLLKNRPTV